MERIEEEEVKQPNLKKQKREFGPGDRISRLPDDVLVFILSRFPIKVAARTSLLSRRWRWLWTCIPRLEFDSSKTLRAIKNRAFGSLSISEFIDSEKVRLVSLVNHLVESYPLPAIDKAKSIELDFSRAVDLHLPDHLYTLSPSKLGLPSSHPLTSLVLKSVKVSGKVLHNFISNSPFLERLCVEGSRSLVHLRVAGPSLHLKYLEISDCSRLRSLKLVAPNLLTLKYSGPYINIPFENVPNLTELSIRNDDDEDLIFTELQQILTFVPQLQKLTLYIDDEVDMVTSIRFPLMNQLRQMKLSVCADNVDSLLFLSSWIKACPSLHRFTLDVTTLTLRPVVEITGFVGETVDTELCMLLIENAIELEKIVITPSVLWNTGRSSSTYHDRTHS
ncbi:hypothetical protein V6N12_027477 [Hibiscus sabdariffa]|uniref:F-box domain-containing protein n=1 Tax=Hibiscus sabdariffa TaxID=183260 RepID=A0ABR2DUW5_9ROSI